MMHRPLFRPLAIFVMILALVVGAQTRLMPMAMASSGADMAGMAADAGTGACKGCLPGKMMVADCSTLCAAMVAVIDIASSPLRNAAPSAWIWSNDPTPSQSCEPDTAPPRA